MLADPTGIKPTTPWSPDAQDGTFHWATEAGSNLWPALLFIYFELQLYKKDTKLFCS